VALATVAKVPVELLGLQIIRLVLQKVKENNYGKSNFIY